MRRIAIAACITAACAFAQQPRIENAQVQTRQVTGGLEAAMNSILAAQTSPAWVGYTVPIVHGDRSMCCYDGNGACTLEGRRTGVTTNASGTPTVELEGPTHLVVLYRIEDRKIGKVRTFTPECTLDAGGLPLIWLNGVQPAESVRYLTPIAREDQRHGAIAAIALHADPSADAALEQLTATSEPEKVRRDAAFWLGVARGHRGFEILSRIVRDDPSDKVREHAIFALSESKDPEALNTIIRVAHDDRSPHVRGQALFWLAHKAGE